MIKLLPPRSYGEIKGLQPPRPAPNRHTATATKKAPAAPGLRTPIYTATSYDGKKGSFSMSNTTLSIPFQTAGDGTTMATINGKVYNLLALYEHSCTDGPFFLIAAGRTPLKPDDLAEHWQVIHRGNIDIAFAQRPSATTSSRAKTPSPHRLRLAPLKAQPMYYAFTGPTQQAIETMIHIVIDQYCPASPSPTTYSSRASTSPSTTTPTTPRRLASQAIEVPMYDVHRFAAELLDVDQDDVQPSWKLVGLMYQYLQLQHRALAIALDRLQEHDPLTASPSRPSTRK